jgi:hypothetical protein
MGLFGTSSGNVAALTPPGIGAGITQDQMSLFAGAANQSGLTDMAMQQANQMTGGLKNEDQVQLIYRLMAAHPNEVALFFLHYPDFVKELAALIALVVRKELYEWFNSGAIPANVDAEKATPWSSITQENLDLQIGKVAPLQQMQMEVNQADMNAMGLMSGHEQNQIVGSIQQQQQQQQQMYQQQMMQQQPPQRQGLGGTLGNFGSNLIRGTLGLPPSQQQIPVQGQMPMYNQQPPMY